MGLILKSIRLNRLRLVAILGVIAWDDWISTIELKQVIKLKLKNKMVKIDMRWMSVIARGAGHCIGSKSRLNGANCN